MDEPGVQYRYSTHRPSSYLLQPNEHCACAGALAVSASKTPSAVIAIPLAGLMARLFAHIIHNIEQLLPNTPQMGCPGRVPGTRELVIPKTPFVVPYRLQRNVIQILRVYHGARRWPESF